jgi:hypothetical protein
MHVKAPLHRNRTAPGNWSTNRTAPYIATTNFDKSTSKPSNASPRNRICLCETDLRRKGKKAGRYRNPGKRVWMLPFHMGLEMRLERRMVDRWGMFIVSMYRNYKSK